MWETGRVCSLGVRSISCHAHYWLTILEPKDGYQYATILATLVAPQSRGNVTLVSADTNDLPIIHTPALQSPTDQQVAVAAYKRTRQAFASNFMQKTVIGEEYFPGPTVQSDEQILEVYLHLLPSFNCEVKNTLT